MRILQLRSKKLSKTQDLRLMEIVKEDGAPEFQIMIAHRKTELRPFPCFEKYSAPPS